MNANKFCRDYVKDKYSIGQLCAQISSVNFDQDIRTCFEDIQVSVFFCLLLVRIIALLPVAVILSSTFLIICRVDISPTLAPCIYHIKPSGSSIVSAVKL